MITALDTNVLLDVFLADRDHGAASRRALSSCMAEGGVVACEVVWTEVAADFLIGAHALHHADPLLSRDRSFWKSAFRGLRVVEPR
jgi:predicted nucleic acid-binding protein